MIEGGKSSDGYIVDYILEKDLAGKNYCDFRKALLFFPFQNALYFLP